MHAYTRLFGTSREEIHGRQRSEQKDKGSDLRNVERERKRERRRRCEVERTWTSSSSRTRSELAIARTLVNRGYNKDGDIGVIM